MILLLYEIVLARCVGHFNLLGVALFVVDIQSTCLVLTMIPLHSVLFVVCFFFLIGTKVFVGPGQAANLGIVEMHAAPMGDNKKKRRRTNHDLQGLITINVREPTVFDLSTYNNNFNGNNLIGNNHNHQNNHNNQNTNNNQNNDDSVSLMYFGQQHQSGQQQHVSANTNHFGGNPIDGGQCAPCANAAAQMHAEMQARMEAHAQASAQFFHQQQQQQQRFTYVSSGNNGLNNHNHNGNNNHNHNNNNHHSHNHNHNNNNNNMMGETFVFNNNQAAMGINDINNINNQKRNNVNNGIVTTNFHLNNMNANNDQGIILSSTFYGRTLVGHINFPYDQTLFWIEKKQSTRYSKEQYTTIVRNMSVTNSFLMPIEIQSVTLNSTQFTVMDVPIGKSLQIGETAVICRLKFEPSSMTPNDNLNMHIKTNVTDDPLPIYVFNGRLRIENTKMDHDSGVSQTFVGYS